MAYTALYRKFRPLKFEDMVGEEHITRTLKNQIISKRVGHAYLFNGGRGTGKTTSAKILARAVNCLNPKDGEPCNECEICKEILEGSLTDVVEMDAASNNSVDDIRGIRDEVNFLPTKAKYRVYIIDEVHMLTTGAFNALLKTLEEPPEHVKFILATTEPQKLPTTILSRCQRFDFKKITNENIIKRLKIICTESNIKIAEDALNLIAILAEGAMRDAISILERCCQESIDEINVDIVKELVGIPSLEYISKISRSIFENNEVEALEVIDNIIDSGKDLNNFLWEVIKYIKDILVFKSTGKLKLYSDDEIAQIKEISELTSRERLLNTINLLSNLENEIKWSSQKTIMFQTGIIKACTDTQMSGVEELKKKVEELENKLANGNIKITSNSSNVDSNVISKSNTSSNAQLLSSTNKNKEVSNKVSETKVESSSSSDINWQDIINKLRTSGKVRLYTSLANTVLNQIGDLILEIEFPNGLTPFVEKILEDSDNKKDLSDLLFRETGKQWHIKYKDGKNSKKIVETKTYENPIDNLGLDINVIE
ncbi:MAG: DNA polymerase III subunit gamma/tau [Clostridia bacterium]|nr:DNA polymerase III subunit gamma/tau [Clostridia bacterium]